jgi:hypothetical protein
VSGAAVKGTRLLGSVSLAFAMLAPVHVDAGDVPGTGGVIELDHVI